MTTKWIVLDANDQVMRCNHCGQTEPLSTISGKPVWMACAIMQAFVKEHRFCKEEK